MAIYNREDYATALPQLEKKLSVDYIVEQGTIGIWTYRKWNSGIAECWGTWSGTLTHYATVFSSGYGYDSGWIDFPNELFKTAPNLQYAGKVGNGFCLCGTSINITKDHMKCYGIATASGSQSCMFNIYAIGRWK